MLGPPPGRCRGLHGSNCVNRAVYILPGAFPIGTSRPQIMSQIVQIFRRQITFMKGTKGPIGNAPGNRWRLSRTSGEKEINIRGDGKLIKTQITWALCVRNIPYF
ncbi:hypothetical protein J6590_082681 [Homalodisca vitripennis]|nr:hypothetical protein J6590_082681 [Homalodisca vitripennis]